MRFYTVHVPAGEEGGAALGDAVLIREGFNWLAFFFAPFWALAHGLWLAALPLIAAPAALVAAPVALGLGPIWPVTLGLGYGVLAGMTANDLRRAGLAARGWRLVEVVAARSRDRAFIRYAEAVAAAPAAAPRPVAAVPAPASGARARDPDPGFWT